MPAGTWDKANRMPTILLSSGDTVATRNMAPTEEHHSILGTIGRSSGLWYFEGLAGGSGSNQIVTLGLAKANALISRAGYWTNADGWAYYGNSGNKIHNGSNVGYGSPWSAGDVIQCAWNANTGNLWWGKNNTYPAGGDPAAGTNPAFTGVSGTLYPVCSLYANEAHVMTLRCLASSQTYSAPSGFLPLASPGTVTVTVRDENGSAITGTSFQWYFFEQASGLTTPIASGTDSTDGSGVLTLIIPSTSMANGDVGTLMLTTTDGSPTSQCIGHNAPIAITI